ncbi:hypothetical protein SELMODRAFT_404158 [Selaginella moellendorffii]|uniref:SPX domain-containing protein n=1 Tax=Selaginella moellendorffii TaxID=88036 RepID=D8QUG2_SELML|nr:hypothetical protein SELMODRAFT_404158 [Selaginella moellendorffii]
MVDEEQKEECKPCSQHQDELELLQEEPLLGSLDTLLLRLAPLLRRLHVVLLLEQISERLVLSHLPAIARHGLLEIQPLAVDIHAAHLLLRSIHPYQSAAMREKRKGKQNGCLRTAPALPLLWRQCWSLDFASALNPRPGLAFPAADPNPRHDRQKTPGKLCSLDRFTGNGVWTGSGTALLGGGAGAATADAAGSSPSPADSSPLRTFSGLTRRKILTWSQSEVLRVRQLPPEELYETEHFGPISQVEEEKMLFARLDGHLNNVNKFYRTKEEEYCKRAEALSRQMPNAGVILSSIEMGNSLERQPIFCSQDVKSPAPYYYDSVPLASIDTPIQEKYISRDGHPRDQEKGDWQESNADLFAGSYFSSSDKAANLMEKVEKLFIRRMYCGGRAAPPAVSASCSGRGGAQLLVVVVVVVILSLVVILEVGGEILVLLML